MGMRRVTRGRQSGFTLLEAIVAMVIMATALLALYSWLSTSMLALNRAQAQTLALEDARIAMAVLDDLNPFVEPTGERRIEPLSVRWRSEPLTERRPGLSQVGFPTQFDFILYRVDVEVWRGETRTRDFSVRKAGWEITRPIDLDAE